MSFVGTRPEVRRYVDAYDAEMLATLLLPPGITSLASIKFKDEDEFIEKYISEDESIDEVYINRVLPLKMKYNLDYLRNFSLLEDFSLMVKTIFAVYKWEKIWSNIQKKN
jgi:lipopolysaccharide/colanic/teichoic acid biosynthesis glycosyltransferase